MKRILRRRPAFIVTVAAVLYAAAMVVTWKLATDRAWERTGKILLAAENVFHEGIYGEIEATLRTLTTAIINILGGKCEATSSKRMREIASLLSIDEINIVDRSAKVVASNIDSVLGGDFNRNEYVREFMTLLETNRTFVAQKFRYGVANPDMYCSYYGAAFPDHDGFVQIGITLGNLRENMYSYSREESERMLRNWHFSVVGWFAHAEDPEFEAGRIFRTEIEGQTVLGRYFDFYGYHYKAFIPESFCYSERNGTVAATAVILAAIFTICCYFILRITSASDKLEALHAAAIARTAEDLAIARTVQMSSLPSATGAFLDFFQFSLEADCRPAREVGGDFYDFYPVASGGRIAFLIADASGKGIPAALFTTEAKSILKNCLIEFSDLTEAVTVANARICAQNEAEMFVTAWVGVLNPRTGLLEYVNAGHNHPFVCRLNGSVEKVDGKGGLFLGMFEDAKYKVHTLTLKPGDRLFLYTDGITEAMDCEKKCFGEKRLVASLARESVQADLAAFVGEAERSDDITVLVLKWNGDPERIEKAFPCADSSLGEAIAFIRETLADIDAKTASRILNAADEIVANIVNYSGSPDFQIRIERVSDRVRLTFSDAGHKYDPLTHVDPDTHAAIENRPIGGLGLVMVKKLVDRVAYARENGRNVLTVIKRTGV